MAQRLRSRATAAVAAGLAATCIGVAAAPAFADTVRNQEWWLTSLHVTKAWLSSRGTGVKVAVLDSGVDPAQPDLAGSVITGRDYTGSGRTAGGPFWGVHGTALASIIAGHGHGPHHADGIMGVAPQAQILSVRVTLDTKDPLLASPTVVAALPQAIARGIDYAVRHGAQVIDLPLDPAVQAGGTTQGGSPAERSAVEAALAKGVVLVAPSGDNGAGTDTVNYPAAYPGVISVGAFGQGFVKAPFTSHQPYATLTAAGNGVIAANGPAAYAKMKSTSAASAVVAGIAALIRSQFPTFTPAQVEQALTSSTVFHHKGERKDGSGFGTADAAAALLAAAKINATPTSSASPGQAGNPTPPTAPKVHVPTKSLWQAVRLPALGLAALLVLALIILVSVRVRQRRALDAQLAPLQAAARASRAQGAAGMTGMGSPGPGYGQPPAAMAPGRAPASSEPAGNGPANFGLDSAGPGRAGAGLAGTGLAGTGFTGSGAGSAGPAGHGFAGRGAAGGAGRPLPGSVARPVVSGKPPWEEDDHRLAPRQPPHRPLRSLAGARAGSCCPAAGWAAWTLRAAQAAAGGSADSGPGGTRPGRDSSGTGRPAGNDSASTLNLGGWSLGKPGSGGTGQPVTGRPGCGRHRQRNRPATGPPATGPPATNPRGPGAQVPGPRDRWPGSAAPARTGPRPRPGPASARHRSMIPRSRSPRSAPRSPGTPPSTTVRSAHRPRAHPLRARPDQVPLPRAPPHRAGPCRAPPRTQTARVRVRGTPAHVPQGATARGAAPRAGTRHGRPAEPTRTLRPGAGPATPRPPRCVRSGPRSG